MKRLIALAAIAALAACAPRPQPEPIVQTVTVEIPIPVPCRPAIGPEPQYADSDAALAAAEDIFDAMKLRIAGRAQRIARDLVKSVALKGCAAGPEATAP